MGGTDEDPEIESFIQQLKREHDNLMRDTGASQQQLEKEGANNNSAFSAFKRFVDSNFSALSDGFRNLPSNIGEIKAKMQREQDRQREEELDISRRWTGSSDSPDHIQMELERSSIKDKEDAIEATNSLLSLAFEKAWPVPPVKIEELFRDSDHMLGDLDRLVNPMLALGGAWYYMPETGDRLPVGQDKWRWLAPSPRWLSVQWFKRSPYSPIRLEAHPDLCRDGAKWRAAFEDLMSASLDKPMSSRERIGVREPHGLRQSTYYGPGLDWMLSLLCRGIIPPLLPRSFNDSHQSLIGLRNTLSTICQDKDLTSIPWSNDSRLAWHSPLDRDLSDLMSEVATQATSKQGLDDQAVQRIDGLSGPEDAKMRALEDGRECLTDALMSGDTQAATEILNDWYRRSPDVKLDELVQEPLDDCRLSAEARSSPTWCSTLAEALRQSDLPGTSLWRMQDFSDYMETKSKRPVEAKDEVVVNYQRRRQELLDELEGWGENTVALPLLGIEALEDRLAWLKQDFENIQQMTGEKAQEPSVPQKSQILSALTTTETTRLPDGTVTTKVVLKKRFADGREMTQESVHTTNEKLEDQKQLQQQQQPEDEESKKKGWFWS